MQVDAISIFLQRENKKSHNEELKSPSKIRLRNDLGLIEDNELYEIWILFETTNVTFSIGIN